jgi:small subunit ribosomal protein S6
MNTYEFTFLLENETYEEDIKKIIQELKGEIKDETKWGKRTLSYPIDKKSSAYYFTHKIEFEPKSLSEFKKKLNFSDKIMRYLILKVQ